MWGSYMPMQRKQKIENLMIRKMVTSRKSKNHNRQSKTRHISVCSCLIAILKMLINPYIFKLARKMNFHLKFLQAILRGGKGGTLMIGPGQHLVLLRHWMVQNINSRKQILNLVSLQ